MIQWSGGEPGIANSGIHIDLNFALQSTGDFGQRYPFKLLQPAFKDMARQFFGLNQIAPLTEMAMMGWLRGSSWMMVGRPASLGKVQRN